MTIRANINDLPNPARRVSELESEVLRLTARVRELEAYDQEQHAAIVRDTLEIAELRERLRGVTDAAQLFAYPELPVHPEMDDEEEIHLTVSVGQLRALRAALSPAPEVHAEHKGFWVTTPDGNAMHVYGDPNMSEETLAALRHMMELAAKQYDAPAPSAAAGESETK